MKTLYVRIVAAAALSRFFRCGMEFGKAWKPVSDLDDATAQRLKEEQMLEVTETRPAELDEVAAGDSAGTLQIAGASVTPAAAPTVAELALAEQLAAAQKQLAEMQAELDDAAQRLAAPAPVDTPPVDAPAVDAPAVEAKPAEAKPAKKAAK